MQINNFPTQIDRNPWIDFFRGISILAVILLHLNIHFPFENTEIGKIIPTQLSKIIFHSGYYGVMIFFVISGFLITSNILKRWDHYSNIHCGQFYQARFARIAPCLLLLIFVLSVLDITGVPGFVVTKASLREYIFATLTFHTNWLEAKVGYLLGSWDCLWSLSVEELFYLVFPLLCFFITNERIFKIILISLIILGPFARNDSNDIWADHSYFSCMDGIAIGCLAALYKNKINSQPYLSKFLFVLGLLLFCIIFLFRHLANQLGITAMGLNVTILEIGLAFILMTINNSKKMHRLILPLQWLGKNSYEIYLTHMFIVMLFAKLFYSLKMSPYLIIIDYLLMIIGCGILGHIVAVYFSSPLNQFFRNVRLKNPEYAN